ARRLVSRLIARQRPASPPFPYTTLFRSRPAPRGRGRPAPRRPRRGGLGPRAPRRTRRRLGGRPRRHPKARDDGAQQAAIARAHRSEEHTSELQSRENLVCRLLLEKKKTS